MKLYSDLAKVYHVMYQGITDYDNEFERYDDWLTKLKCSKILEVGCGTGRLARRLVDAGYAYIGLDLSESMLDIAREENRDIHFIQGDMRDINIKETFDAVLVTGRSFTTMTQNQDVLNALNSFNQVLRKDCFLIFDNFYAGQIFRNFREKFLQEVKVDGVTYKRTSTNKMNLETGWTWDWTALYEIKQGDEVKTIDDKMRVRAFTRDELELFLNLCGFEFTDSRIEGSSIYVTAMKSN